MSLLIRLLTYKTQAISSTEHTARSLAESDLVTHQSLQDAEKIVAAAVSKYGTVHVVIFNTSFQHDGMTTDLWSSERWEHLQQGVTKGAYKVNPKAWHLDVIADLASLSKPYGLYFERIAMGESCL